MRNDFCTGYLAHSAKGKEWASHKYIAKQPLGNGLYKYFYSQAELDAFLKKKGGGSKVSNQIGAKNYDKNASRQRTKMVVSSANTQAVKSDLSSKNDTTNANKKTASEVTLKDTKSQQATGKAAADKLLSTSSDTTSKKSSGKSSSSSKKSSSTGSKKSGSSSSSSGSSKKASSGTSKEKSTSTKAAKSTSSKTTKTSNVAENVPINMNTLKKVYGKSDSDISSFSGTATEFKNNLLEKYDDGAFGYLTAGDTVYKFAIQNGDVILKDYDSDKEVSFNDYLKDAKEFKEFRTNKKNK